MLTTFDSRVFRVGRRVDVQYDVWLLLLFRWLGIRWVLWMVDGSCGWSEEIRWVELRFSPSRDPICPSYPIIAWDEADSRGSLRNIAATVDAAVRAASRPLAPHFPWWLSGCAPAAVRSACRGSLCPSTERRNVLARDMPWRTPPAPVVVRRPTSRHPVACSQLTPSHQQAPTSAGCHVEPGAEPGAGTGFVLSHVLSLPVLSLRARTSAKVSPSNVHGPAPAANEALLTKNEALHELDVGAGPVASAFGSMQVGSPGARRRRSVSKEQVGSPQVVSPERRRSGSLPSVLTRDMAIDLSNFIYTKPALRITGRWAPPRF